MELTNNYESNNNSFNSSFEIEGDFIPNIDCAPKIKFVHNDNLDQLLNDPISKLKLFSNKPKIGKYPQQKFSGTSITTERE